MKKNFIPDHAASVLRRFGKAMKQMLYKDRSPSDFVDRLRVPAYNMLKDRLAKVCSFPENVEDRTMRLVEKICLRAFFDLKKQADLKGFETCSQVPQPAGSIDLSIYPNIPSISRRDIVVPSSVVEVWQNQSNQIYTINPYVEQGMDLFLGSELAKQPKFADEWLGRFIDTFYMPACGLVDYSIPTDFGCYRSRAHQNNAGGMGGMQGPDIAKMCTWSNQSRRIAHSETNAFLFVVRVGYGATVKNYEEILADPDPHTTYGTKAVHGALVLKEWKETGRTSALLGLDMITSLLMLIAIITGNRSLAKKVGLFLKGRPWDKGWRGVDPWASVGRSVCRHDSSLAGIDPKDPRVRKLVKAGGTPWGFNAGTDTMSWALLNLNSDRDGLNIEASNNMENILKRLEWPELLHRDKVDSMSVHAQLRQMRKHAKHLTRALENSLPEVSDFNTERNELMRNAIVHGCPTVQTPDGWETELEPWYRNKHRGHVIDLSVDGDKEEVWVTDLTHNPMPNFQTAEAHTWESWFMREFARRFSIARNRPMADVFDAVYVLGCDFELAMRIATEVLIDMARHFDEHGSASQQYAALIGKDEFPRRQFTAADIDPMCSVMNA